MRDFEKEITYPLRFFDGTHFEIYFNILTVSKSNKKIHTFTTSQKKKYLRDTSKSLPGSEMTGLNGVTFRCATDKVRIRIRIRIVYW